MDDNFFINGPIKKLKAPEYSPLETIQLLFQAFFNITNNKRDIQIKRKSSSDRKIFVQKFHFVLGEHDTIGGRLKNFSEK